MTIARIPNRRFATALLAAFLAACASTKKVPEANVNLAGYPPEFRAGYADGCASSKRSAGKVRDEDRFKRDNQYASGWRDGFDICSRQKK